MSACKDCKFWGDSDEEETQVLRVKRCTKAVQMWDATMWNDDYDRVPLPEYENQLMFVNDGSSYRADLYTKSEFFCAHFAAHPEPSPDGK